MFIINVDDMSLLKTVTDTGDGPYGVDQEGGATAYALTRKTESVTVIENYFDEDVNILMGSFIWAGEGDGM